MASDLSTLVSHPLSDKRLQVDALDGVRGLAVLFVVFSHLSNSKLNVIPGFDLGGSGKIGVYLFFVLSSFLLSTPFLRRGIADFRSRGVWKHYFKRRFFRVYPLFFAVLVLSFLFTAVFGRYTGGHGLPFTISLKDLVTHLLLQDGKSVLWSIPVEFKYYFVLPVVVFVLAIVLRNKLWLGMLATAAAIWLSTTLWPPALARANDTSLGPYLPIFLLGALAAVASHNIHRATAINQREWFKYAMEATAILAMLAVIATVPSVFRYLAQADVDKGYFHREFVWYGLLWSLFIVGLLHGKGWVRAAMSWFPLRFIGFISFSLYLWHLSVLLVVKQFVPGPGIFKAYLILVVAVAIATLSYFFIEKPFLRIRKKALAPAGVEAAR